MKILIIEDERTLVKLIEKNFIRENFVVDKAYDGKTGLDMAIINDYDCILLDLNLPEIDGIEVAKKLRTEKNTTPVLMLTARSQIYDKITGFESGTDDYVTKPFDMKELILRVKALIRRNSLEKQQELVHKNLTLYPDRNIVKINSTEINLSNKETSILEYLLRNKGKIISAEELLEHVWDSNTDFFTQTVKTHIKTLRKKIDPQKKFVKTVKGKGYQLT